MRSTVHTDRIYTIPDAGRRYSVKDVSQRRVSYLTNSRASRLA